MKEEPSGRVRLRPTYLLILTFHLGDCEAEWTDNFILQRSRYAMKYIYLSFCFGLLFISFSFCFFIIIAF